MRPEEVRIMISLTASLLFGVLILTFWNVILGLSIYCITALIAIRHAEKLDTEIAYLLPAAIFLSFSALNFRAGVSSTELLYSGPIISSSLAISSAYSKNIRIFEASQFFVFLSVSQIIVFSLLENFSPSLLFYLTFSIAFMDNDKAKKHILSPSIPLFGIFFGIISCEVILQGGLGTETELVVNAAHHQWIVFLSAPTLGAAMFYLVRDILSFDYIHEEE